MPIEVIFSHGGAGVTYIGSGMITGEDLQQANQLAFQSTEILQRIRFAFLDFSEVTSTDIEMSDVQRTAQQDELAAQSNPQAVVAIVAGADVIFGLSRMWETFVDTTDWKTLITRSLAEARQWIKDETGFEVE